MNLDDKYVTNKNHEENDCPDQAVKHGNQEEDYNAVNSKEILQEAKGGTMRFRRRIFWIWTRPVLSYRLLRK